MFEKLVNGMIVGASYFAVLHLGWITGVKAMKYEIERKQLIRENEELKRELNSKRGR